MSIKRFALSLSVVVAVVFTIPVSSLQARDNATILILGDSLSAAFGMPVENGWVNLLRQRLAERYPQYQVINASISGETSQGGLTRLPKLLQNHQPDVVVIELGGNDGLRGLPPTLLQQNLEKMVALSRDAGARVLLVGMQMPPNYGPAYTELFQTIYYRVADKKQVTLVPFLLEGVAGNAELMQGDGIHAEAAAQPRLLENVWEKLEPLLKQLHVAR